MILFDILDKIVGAVIGKKRLAEQLQAYAKLRDHPSNVAVLGEFQSLDAKSSSLLQHISIMIAALSVSYTVNPPASVKTLLVFNIFFYLIAIFLLLRVIVTVDFSGQDDTGRRLLRELKIRERYYAVAHSIASFLTAILVLAIAVVALRHLSN